MPRIILFELLNGLSEIEKAQFLTIILNYYNNLVELDAFSPTDLSQRAALLEALDNILDRNIDAYNSDEFILSDLLNEFLRQQPAPLETSSIVTMIRIFYSNNPWFSHMDLSYEGIIRIRNDAISRAAREQDELDQDAINPVYEDIRDNSINGLPLQ